MKVHLSNIELSKRKRKPFEKHFKDDVFICDQKSKSIILRIEM